MYLTKFTFNKLRACIKVVRTRKTFTLKYVIALISLLHLWRRVFDIFREWTIRINLIYGQPNMSKVVDWGVDE